MQSLSLLLHYLETDILASPQYQQKKEGPSITYKTVVLYEQFPGFSAFLICQVIYRPAHSGILIHSSQ